MDKQDIAGFREFCIQKAREAGFTEEYLTHNPYDAFMRALARKQVPKRNDCGYPGRYEHEDTARMFGWGVEGKGLCDYPKWCPWFREGRCPFGEAEKQRVG